MKCYKSDCSLNTIEEIEVEKIFIDGASTSVILSKSKKLYEWTMNTKYRKTKREAVQDLVKYWELMIESKKREIEDIKFEMINYKKRLKSWSKQLKNEL